jgi:SAM-dependent methyltransferase
MGISNLELSATSAESLDALPSGTFDAVLCRWGLMYMAAPARALAHARRLLQPARPLVVAVWALPSPWATLPQQVFAQQGIVAPAPLRALRYEEPAVLDAELRAAGFAIGHSVEMTTAVMEAETGAEVATWYHDLGFLRALDPLSPPRRALAESMLAAEAEGLRAGRSIQLLGTTRIVVALAPG